MREVITILLNPKAGGAGGRELRAELARLFEAAAVPVRIVSPPSAAAAADAAREAVESGAPAVVAIGGDGTISGIASALVGSNAALGVIPAGTLNHFARDLGIPPDLARAVSTIAAGHVTHIDVGTVNDRIFLNNSSIGIYPDVVLARDELRREGHRKWIAFVLATMKILRRYRGVVVRITEGGSTRSVRTPFLFIGNNEYQVVGPKLGARTSLAGGRLFAYLAPRVRPRDLPKLLAWALLGRPALHGALESFGAAEFRVETTRRKRIRVALDGEVTHLRTPLHYRVRPRALKVIVPAG
jgi:YegS/Rv2252/BmrU family lipid kinase